ncbi:hypothetical protein PAXRUDRAFT_170958 [Paxillus rubicundulus Ve08.2h10]|uniref:Unplaced genomic scaffold scaffold_2861, whole genome shotgun sequence n=1 Tax=Paxillus rubicundulus Ve08.2h10 TaxID=930991 RepID=A0A0D0CY01_9AGAM|nr:hypothetical protein PAXRUDRAFT_170958 [Paxillus rubicundulus Ve08.2h10]
MHQKLISLPFRQKIEWLARLNHRLYKSKYYQRIKKTTVADVVNTYWEEQEQPAEDRKSLQTICQEVQGRWQSKKGYASVTVSRDTVGRRLDGGRSFHQVNVETNTWLIYEEEEQLITFCVELASQRFPLNHQALKLHVDAILHTQLGTSFPEAGVGTDWTVFPGVTYCPLGFLLEGTTQYCSWEGCQQAHQYSMVQLTWKDHCSTKDRGGLSLGCRQDWVSAWWRFEGTSHLAS